MKYVQEIPPDERQHEVILSDSECKIILEMASMFADCDATMENSLGIKYKPSSVGVKVLIGLLDIRNSVDLKNSNLENNWENIALA